MHIYVNTFPKSCSGTREPLNLRNSGYRATPEAKNCTPRRETSCSIYFDRFQRDIPLFLTMFNPKKAVSSHQPPASSQQSAAAQRRQEGKKARPRGGTANFGVEFWKIGSGRGKYTLRRGEFSVILSDSCSFLFL